jgi:hypothetical protein
MPRPAYDQLIQDLNSLMYCNPSYRDTFETLIAYVSQTSAQYEQFVLDQTDDYINNLWLNNQEST